MVCRGVVVVIPVEEVILGGIGKNDLHVLEDLQPARRPALPPDVAIQWHQLAERACLRMLLKVFPTGVSFQGNTHQMLCLPDASRVCSTKPLHFHVGLKRVVGTGATILRPEAQAWQAPWAVPLSGASRADPQNNCATGFPIHPTAAAFSQTHSPIDTSTAHAFLSHALSSNDHMGTHGCHAHHTEGRVEGWLVNSDHTACYREAGWALLQHQRPSAALSKSLYLKPSHH